MIYISKFLIFFFLSCSAIAADYFSEIRIEDRTGRNSLSDSETYGIAFGKYINPNFEIDIFTRKKYPHSGISNSRVEIGAKYKNKINDSFSFFSRLAIGKKYLHAENYSYWNIENGLKLNFSKKIDGVVSLRFRESFNQVKWNEFDRTYKIGLVYKISDIYSFTTNLNHARGESQFDSIGLNFKVNF
jgi:hypothetical protein